MKNLTAVLLAPVLVIGAGLAVFSAPAYAASTSELIAQCATALEERGIASSDEYRVKFVSVSGGAAQKLTLKLLPKSDGEAKVVTCKVRRGEIVDLRLAA